LYTPIERIKQGRECGSVVEYLECVRHWVQIPEVEKKRKDK
jgi:hypothetical protein